MTPATLWFELISVFITLKGQSIGSISADEASVCQSTGDNLSKKHIKLFEHLYLRPMYEKRSTVSHIRTITDLEGLTTQLQRTTENVEHSCGKKNPDFALWIQESSVVIVVEH